ncbi:MAG: hypothetical protein JKY56_25085 [Kofleriaceae bacterium]|nr:hypothetical protein [Kofleriaceae bacterium]
MNNFRPQVRHFLACVFLFFGCGSTSATGAHGSKAPTSSSHVQAALRAIPASAAVVVTIASPEAFWEFLVDGGLVPMDSKIVRTYQDELRAHFDRHLGLDISLTSSVVGAVIIDQKNPEGLIVAYPVHGQLRSKQHRIENKLLFLNDSYVVTLEGQHLIAGSYQSVQSALQVLKGQGKSIQDAGAFGSFVQSQMKGAYLSVSADVSKLPLPPNPITPDITYGSLRVTSIA